MRGLIVTTFTLFLSTSVAAQAEVPKWAFARDEKVPGIELPALNPAVAQRLSSGQKRLALLLCNGNGYLAKDEKLPKSEQDCRSMAILLRHYGFEVYGKINFKMAEAKSLVHDFVGIVSQYESPLVVGYYSGHGASIDGMNYFIPVDMPAGYGPFDFKKAALDQSTLELIGKIRKPDGTQVETQLVLLLDACRNNAFVMGKTFGTDGLTARPPIPGSLVGYAAQEGKKAYANGSDEAHSVFTQFLLSEMANPAGRSLATVLNKVQTLVAERTDDVQRPVVMSEMGEVHIVPPACTAAEAATAWVNAQHSNTAAGYRAFAERCSDSPNAGVALDKAAISEEREQLRQERERLLQQQASGASAGAVSASPVQTAMLPPPASSVAGSVVPSGIKMVSGRWGEAGSVFRDRSVGLDMVVIPPGSFMMGSPDTGKGRSTSEGLVHEVRISRSFAVGKYEVTVGQYRRFVEATGREQADCTFPEGVNWSSPGFAQGKDYPVVCVSWDDAKAFVSWLNDQVVSGVRSIYDDASAGPYRLLTEAEFEYAARGVTSSSAPHREYWWGEAFSRNYVNGRETGGKDRYKHTSPVGSFPLNPFGLSDILGNVWELTEDCWVDSNMPLPVDSSAKQEMDRCYRVLRGGSWDDLPRNLSAASRISVPSGDRNGDFGFRVARTIIP